MTSSLLFNGGFSYLLDDGSVETLSYGTVTPIVPSETWDATTGRPDQGLVERGEHDHRQLGPRADTVVMGADALSVFLNHATVAEQLNKLHLVTGGIQPTAPQGVGTAQFIGRLFGPTSASTVTPRHTRTRRPTCSSR